MAHELLGESFDIHGGGLDLQFPHHENEIAQSACAHPHGDFARYWLHNEMLQVEGKKMSKSLGNFFTVRDLLDRGVPGEVIRFVFLQTHYSKPMDWTEEKAREATETLAGFFYITDGVEADDCPPESIMLALSNDLNTPGAIAILHDLRHNAPASTLKAALNLLGFPKAEDVEWFRSRRVTSSVSNGVPYAHLIWPHLERWAEMRKHRQFHQADALKKDLEATGLRLVVTASGPEAVVPHGFDPAKLEALK
jgi:cysteinyl-tRNA synthetase